MRKHVCLLAVLMVISPLVLAQEKPAEAPTPAPARAPATAKEIWRLEHLYWDYVKTFDAEHYKALWHPDFVGWPATSAAPVGVEHITDWFTVFQKNGSTLKYANIKPAGIQTFGNVVVVHYWLTSLWTDKEGGGTPKTYKLTHTWMRAGDRWQIIGGMSALVEPVK
ncbi:MAG TPA: nuclear transport factor 2 family protein [Candidatus Acidoferrales bacterium]|nr:nuclear transport factor 2 family protein [Candidatus Acidoferrales bacterium]